MLYYAFIYTTICLNLIDLFVVIAERLIMTFDIVYQELIDLAKPQTYKTYKKHGAGDNILGVKIGSIRKLQRKYKTNHEIALKLWETGKMEARCLAALLADPKEIKEEILDRWIHDIDYYYLAELFAKGLVVKTDHARKKALEWSASNQEYIKRVAFDTISALCKTSKPIKNDYLINFLEKIEEEIHVSPNRAKQAMNLALINIGKRNIELHEYAINIARKIGNVELELGATACKNYNAYEELKMYY